jgi:hypothetical protein
MRVETMNLDKKLGLNSSGFNITDFVGRAEERNDFMLNDLGVCNLRFR